MIEKIKKGWHRWRVFKEVEPDHRFQTRYNNHRQRRRRGEAPATAGSSTWSAAAR